MNIRIQSMRIDHENIGYRRYRPGTISSSRGGIFLDKSSEICQNSDQIVCYNTMRQATKGHKFHACMKIYDFVEFEEK